MLLFALLALAGCNDESEADPSGSDTAGDATAGGSPSPDDGVEPAEDQEGDDAETDRLSPPDEPEPSIDLTGPVDEIERIYREQDAYRSWLFRHPDPANPERLSRIVHRDCPCWESDRKLLTHYAEQKTWWTGADTDIVNVEVVEQLAPHLVRLHVVWRREAGSRLVDETGEVHDELPQVRAKKEVLMRRGTFDPNRPSRDRVNDSWKIISGQELEHEEATEDGRD